MKLWQYLKSKMQEHLDSVAFTQGKITYSRLIEIVEDSTFNIKHKLILASGETNQEQAINILKILANENVAVPVTDKYGKELHQKIQIEVENNKEIYENLAFVMFTSGTTGAPKGVMLTDENIVENLKGIDNYFKVSRCEKLLICRPLVHIAVLTGELLFGLCNGLELDFYEEDFQPKRLAKYIDNNKIEIFCCTPTLIYHLSNYLIGNNVKSIVLSGEKLTEKVVKILNDKYKNIDLYNVYGLTENSPRVSALIPNEFFQKVGSVGKAILNTEIKVENGELLVKSNSIMKGYLDNESLTKEKIIDEYLHTGDMAKIDNDGYIYILGRKDEMIIRCGLNIYPSEIENIVLSLDQIENVLVFGIDDEAFGQKICLKYDGNIEIIDLRKLLLEKLPSHLMPNIIEKVEKLELTISGKVKRK